MDENEYRLTYHTINPQRCVFEKAVLTRRFHCAHLIKHNIAEREAAACADKQGCSLCSDLLAQLRQNARFILHESNPSALAHAKEIKIQCGGLQGLHALISTNNAPAEVDNIYGLIQQLLAQFETLAALPYPLILPYITRFEGRRKRLRP